METTQEFLRNAKIILQNKKDRRYYTLPFALLNLEEVVKITTSKAVANQAARLALSEDQAVGFAIVDADTGKTWMLVAGGNPATSGDWLQLGDRDISVSDVSGLGSYLDSLQSAMDDFETALDGKMANTNAAVTAAIAEDPAAVREALQPPAGTITNVALVGDSITQSTFPASPSNFFRSRGWGTWFRSALQGRINLVKNTNTGEFTFAKSGATTADYVTGGPQRALMTAALASSADTIILMLGANDVAASGITTATTIANLTALWDESLAAGKQVVIVGIIPVRNDHPAARYYPTKAAIVNAWMRKRAEQLGSLYVDAASFVDLDGDLYKEFEFGDDNIHPGILGAQKIGLGIAKTVLPHAAESTSYSWPVYDDAKWITPNPYTAGTIGANQTATSWVVSDPFGLATVVKNIAARQDGVTGSGGSAANWQEVVVSGMSLTDIRKASPTDYAQVYIRNSTATITSGKSYKCVCELQLLGQHEFYGFYLDLRIAGSKSQDFLPDGSMATAWNTLDEFSGILETPVWVATSSGTMDCFAFLTVYGNGTFRVGRLGIIQID